MAVTTRTMDGVDYVFFLLSYDRRADVAYRTNFTVWDFVFLILLSSTIWIWKKRSSDLFSFNSSIDLPSKTRVVTNKKTREKLKIKGETHEEDIKEVFCCCCLLCCAWGPFNFWHTTKKQQKKKHSSTEYDTLTHLPLLKSESLIRANNVLPLNWSKKRTWRRAKRWKIENEGAPIRLYLNVSYGFFSSGLFFFCRVIEQTLWSGSCLIFHHKTRNATQLWNYLCES